MRDALAEQLLAEVMEWTETDVAGERPLLQAMASLKYDEYGQFQPGMRFVESLALWLHQFDTLEEKQTAYEFVKTGWCSARRRRCRTWCPSRTPISCDLI